MKTKAIEIPKIVVWQAYQKVKANKGAAGVDRQSLEDFEQNLNGNLYKIWNRLSSGSYFPPPVKQVPIPKKNGGVRYLGVPTVADRVAQTVVKLYLEPLWEPLFHPDSYGYRPGKSAKDAISITRKRCWEYDWVVEFDIKGAFDNIDRTLLMKAVRKHCPQKWLIMYIERWLAAPVQTRDGKLITRDQGMPQGGVLSPLLMNLFMHYTFDYWMQRSHPDNKFARFADDAVIHCRTRLGAERMLETIKMRLEECKLEMHPDKSKIVYCKDKQRKGNYETIQFTFLGFTFRPRQARKSGQAPFTGFLPAVSQEALKKMRQRIRESRLHRRVDLSLKEIAEYWNPVIQGWWNYYGAFYPTEMRKIVDYFHKKLMQWVRRKYLKLKGRKKASRDWLIKVAERYPWLLRSTQIFRIPLAG